MKLENSEQINKLNEEINAFKNKAKKINKANQRMADEQETTEN